MFVAYCILNTAMNIIKVLLHQKDLYGKATINDHS